MEIVRVKYRTHVAQTMPGDGRDFGFCTSGESQPGNGGPAKIIESHPDNSSLRARLCQDARKPSLVHGRLSLEVRMIGPRLIAESKAAFKGVPTGMETRAPVFDCLNRIRVPS